MLKHKHKSFHKYAILLFFFRFSKKYILAINIAKAEHIASFTIYTRVCKISHRRLFYIKIKTFE